MSPGPRSAVRAIFFDAGNTLLRMNYAAIAGVLAAHGRALAPETIQRAEWRARVRLDEALLAAGAPRVSTESRATAQRYVALILEELDIADDALARAMAEWRAAYNPPVGPWNTAEPSAERALRLTREAALTGGVISNSNGSVRSILEALGLARHLDFVLDSGEVGVEKPDPRIFRLALERAGVAASEAVYIGDLYSVDVLGARAAGLAAILLDPGGHWAARDCLRAPDVLAAVELIVYSSGSVTNG
jgi:putative hydrolase of the HAD superfamily